MSITSDEAYRSAGVDLKRADAVVEVAKTAAASTAMPWVLGGIGGFSGAFEIPSTYRQPVMLAACDGVGTKLKLAFEAGEYFNVGIDLVAMSVNDILVQGGQPLIFLDYFATGKIETKIVAQVLEGIADGCRRAGCALVGGETAEMPGFYQAQEFDLAGFCMGVAEKEAMLPRLKEVGAGDVLIGLASSGLHSNGYSLVRKILFHDRKLTLSERPDQLLGKSLKEELLAPTRIYVKPVLELLEAFPGEVKAMAHVTGGGFYDNIPRVLPENVTAVIQDKSWPVLPVFEYLRRTGSLDSRTMYRTFNCGIGYVLVANAAKADELLDWFAQHAPEVGAYRLGKLETGNREVVFQ